jgi:hypothetical protein
MPPHLQGHGSGSAAQPARRQRQCSSRHLSHSSHRGHSSQHGSSQCGAPARANCACMCSSSSASRPGHRGLSTHSSSTRCPWIPPGHIQQRPISGDGRSTVACQLRCHHGRSQQPAAAAAAGTAAAAQTPGRGPARYSTVRRLAGAAQQESPQEGTRSGAGCSCSFRCCCCRRRRRCHSCCCRFSPSPVRPATWPAGPTAWPQPPAAPATPAPATAQATRQPTTCQAGLAPVSRAAAATPSGPALRQCQPPFSPAQQPGALPQHKPGALEPGLPGSWTLWPAGPPARPA